MPNGHFVNVWHYWSPYRYCSWNEHRPQATHLNYPSYPELAGTSFFFTKSVPYTMVQPDGKKKWMLHKRPVQAVRLIQIRSIKWRLSRLRWMSYHKAQHYGGYVLLLMIFWTSIMNIYILYYFICVNSPWYGSTVLGTLCKYLCYSCFSPRYLSSASTKLAKTALWLSERKNCFWL